MLLSADLNDEVRTLPVSRYSRTNTIAFPIKNATMNLLSSFIGVHVPRLPPMRISSHRQC